jgi:hypothetical protein
VRSNRFTWERALNPDGWSRSSMVRWKKMRFRGEAAVSLAERHCFEASEQRWRRFPSRQTPAGPFQKRAG